MTKKNIVALIIAIIIVGLALAEKAGWPFLAQPLQNKISDLLKRQVILVESKHPDKNTKQALVAEPFSIRFLGGITLKTQKLVISAPSWSTKPYFVSTDKLALKVRYVDIWHAYKDKPIRIKSLQAQNLQAYVERLEDGRASWQFTRTPQKQKQPVQIPTFDYLSLAKALVQINDVPTQSNIKANVSFSTISDKSKSPNHSPRLSDSTPLNDSIKQNRSSNSPDLVQRNSAQLKSESVTDKNSAKDSAKDSASSKLNQLNATATGTYKKLPLKINLSAVGELPNSKHSVPRQAVALTFDAKIEKANLKFKGTTPDMMNPKNFTGDFEIKGPSMAAVGDVVNVTLPTTAPFNTKGTLSKQGSVWEAYVKQMVIGSSRLNGRFTYDNALKTPLLKGKLGGKLVITDLGPAFGTDARKKTNKVLPDRPFDLAALKKMNADVQIDMQHLDLKSTFLEPLKPLQAHLTLNDANLTLNAINASTAGGNLKGSINLNGAGKVALLNTNLTWNNVILERWIKQKRDKGLPPYISGKLNGHVKLKGQGRSTAQLLASLEGTVDSEITHGAISHLGIEIAGLDLAQGIGVLFEGDEALPLDCAIVNLQAKKGLFKPKMIVADTADSTVWMDGSLSLANESLNLRAMSLPKDFSPLTIRTPLNITGSFADPEVSLDKKPIGIRLAASVLLAIINPIAAVVPFLDPGNSKEADARETGCKKLMQSNKR